MLLCHQNILAHGHILCVSDFSRRSLAEHVRRNMQSVAFPVRWMRAVYLSLAQTSIQESYIAEFVTIDNNLRKENKQMELTLVVRIMAGWPCWSKNKLIPTTRNPDKNAKSDNIISKVALPCVHTKASGYAYPRESQHSTITQKVHDFTNWRINKTGLLSMSLSWFLHILAVISRRMGLPKLSFQAS